MLLVKARGDCYALLISTNPVASGQAVEVGVTLNLDLKRWAFPGSRKHNHEAGRVSI
jgi:hypothetical protein